VSPVRCRKPMYCSNIPFRKSDGSDGFGSGLFWGSQGHGGSRIERMAVGFIALGALIVVLYAMEHALAPYLYTQLEERRSKDYVRKYRNVIRTTWALLLAACVISLAASLSDAMVYALFGSAAICGFVSWVYIQDRH
jgi:hypothetical protein